MCFRHPHEDDLENMQLAYGDNLAKEYFAHIEEVCPGEIKDEDTK